MKTIFDWLTMPAFRERTGMYIGFRDMKTLDSWILGYRFACRDADEAERLRTPNGVPIDLLRDYIAMKESDQSTGSIAYILQEAVRVHDDRQIVDRFFSHVDAFMRLSVRTVQHAKVTPDMKPDFCCRQEDMPTEFRKISLTEGLCWVVEETPSWEWYWSCVLSHFGTIGPEADADRLLQQTFQGTFVWQPTDGSCYPCGYYAGHNP